MATPRLDVLDVPPAVQLDPWDFHPPGHYVWPRRAFITSLIGELGANLAVGRTMALRLVGFSWPKFLEPQDPKWRWLYIARAPSAEIVKIGLSANPVIRMQSLRTAIPKMPAHEFELLGTLPFCSRAHESTLCELFGGSLFSGKEWLRENAATRILCWMVTEFRNPGAHKRARCDLGERISDMVAGLQCVTRGAGAIPTYGFFTHGLRSRACGRCGSHRHDARCCPSKKAASPAYSAPETLAGG